MTLEDLRAFTLSLIGVTEDIKWEHNLCFSVGGKLFLITNPDSSPISISCKVEAEDFEEWVARPGIVPAPYLARNGWILVENISKMEKGRLISLIKGSYDLIFNKLSKKNKAIVLGSVSGY